MKTYKKNGRFLNMRDGFASTFNDFFNRIQNNEDINLVAKWINDKLEQHGDNQHRKDFTLATMLDGERVVLRNYIQNQQFDKILLALKVFIATELPDIFSDELQTLMCAIQDKKNLCHKDEGISSSLKEIINSTFDNYVTKEELFPVYNLLGDESSVNESNAQLDS